uniref:Teleost multiple tissue opsin 3a n=1 Tax=Hucho hucho TaxID=62062 RepID=A0A4W5K7B8_9TELE
MVVRIPVLNFSTTKRGASNLSTNVSDGDILLPQGSFGLSRSGHTVVAVCLGLLLVLGFFNNLVLLIFAKFRLLWTPINLILLNISVSDILACIFGTPFSFAASIQGRWFIGHHGCKWYGFANSFFCATLLSKGNTNPSSGFPKIGPGAPPGCTSWQKTKRVAKINLLSAQRREQHVLIMVLSMVSCYLLCWMPYGVMALVATFGRSGLVTPVASVVPTVLAKSSTVISTVILDFYRCFVAFVRCRGEPQSVYGFNTQQSSRENTTPGTENPSCCEFFSIYLLLMLTHYTIS